MLGLLHYLSHFSCTYALCPNLCSYARHLRLFSLALSTAASDCRVQGGSETFERQSAVLSTSK